MSNFKKIAQEYEKTLTEHRGVSPRSYMAEENLKAVIRYAEEILDMMNERDDFPDWCDDKLSVAKHLVEDVCTYVANQKEKKVASVTRSVMPVYPIHDEDYRVENIMQKARHYEQAAEVAEAMEDYAKAQRYKEKAQELLDQAVSLLED